MKKLTVPLVISLLFSVMAITSPFALAAKPDKGSSGKKMEKAYQKEQRKEEKLYRKEQKRTAKAVSKEEKSLEKESRKADKATDDDKLRGLDKQRIKKAEQEQKELDKGSDQGQTSRENRKKWWKFWE
ncbi:MAG: hypothetical protein RPU64_06725 [Candidatus Sedimenticola sp. (ex Thyasira tokunagai)]